MPYVMVPVPEEFVEEVMQFVIRAVARASIQPWDEQSITQLFSEVDESSRSLLSFVARAALAGSDLAEAEAASKMQLSGRETVAIMSELNGLAREADHPNLITARMIAERLPNGRTKDKRVFLIDYDIAGLVQAAERADLLSEPHPLGGTTE